MKVKIVGTATIKPGIEIKPETWLDMLHLLSIDRNMERLKKH